MANNKFLKEELGFGSEASSIGSEEIVSFDLSPPQKVPTPFVSKPVTPVTPVTPFTPVVENEYKSSSNRPSITLLQRRSSQDTNPPERPRAVKEIRGGSIVQSDIDRFSDIPPSRDVSITDKHPIEMLLNRIREIPEETSQVLRRERRKWEEEFEAIVDRKYEKYQRLKEKFVQILNDQLSSQGIYGSLQQDIFDIGKGVQRSAEMLQDIAEQLKTYTKGQAQQREQEIQNQIQTLQSMYAEYDAKVLQYQQQKQWVYSESQSLDLAYKQGLQIHFETLKNINKQRQSMIRSKQLLISELSMNRNDSSQQLANTNVKETQLQGEIRAQFLEYERKKAEQMFQRQIIDEKRRQLISLMGTQIEEMRSKTIPYSSRLDNLKQEARNLENKVKQAQEQSKMLDEEIQSIENSRQELKERQQKMYTLSLEVEGLGALIGNIITKA